ncbi:hypothetical protein BH10PSE18_BH10PSE18_46780 [soil metagenome]
MFSVTSTSWLLACTAALAFLLAPAEQAAAQSLGCNGYLVGVGDSRVSVLQKCGEPLDREFVCVQRLQPGWIVSPNRGGGPTAILTPQCVPMEDWTYYRGPGSFLGIVRLYNGAVESVRDGDRMR